MAFMKNIIKQWSEMVIPAGSEAAHLPSVLATFKDIADSTEIDRLGNGIVRKNGVGPHVALVAHIDEPGIMVNHIEENGFLRFLTIGSLEAKQLIGQHVRFTNQTRGIIGCEMKDANTSLSVDDLYIDLGVDSAEEAYHLAPIGISAVLDVPFAELGEHRLSGRALDNRAGCVAAADAFRQLADEGRQVTLVFSAQSVVGARGAKTAAFALQPDLVLVIDSAPAGDMPKAKRMDLRLGHGPALKIMDGTVITPLRVKNVLQDAAETLGINIQHEVWPGGQSDAGQIHLSQAGLMVGGLSIPTRYTGQLSQVIDVRDVESLVKWAVAAANQWKA
ncbi:M42 family peptidase [Alicyclobacillus sp. TC]|nr:M42 family peptidase [Alicyclobacillus sp. TC]